MHPNPTVITWMAVAEWWAEGHYTGASICPKLHHIVYSESDLSALSSVSHLELYR